MKSKGTENEHKEMQSDYKHTKMTIKLHKYIDKYTEIQNNYRVTKRPQSEERERE